jgi:hypothetical protein
VTTPLLPARPAKPSIARFLIAIDGVPTRDANRFAEHLKTVDFGWWHQVPSMWIVAATEGTTNVDALVALARRFMPNGNVFVCRFSVWAGYLPCPDGGEKWLKDHLNATVGK